MEFWLRHNIQPDSCVFYIFVFQRQGMGFAGFDIKMVLNDCSRFDAAVIGGSSIYYTGFFADVVGYNDQIQKIS